MRPHAGLSALCAGLFVLPGGAWAEGSAPDPLAKGRIVELSLGVFAPANGLQDTLTTPNGGGARLQSTDLLDFGAGARVLMGYSQDWGQNGRLIFSLSGSQASGDTTIFIGPAAETFPGSYDDGYNLPADWTVDAEVETRLAMLKIGREWTLTDGWKVSAGLQGGTASQDFSGILRTTDGEAWRSIGTQSDNMMYGVFGGASHYTALNSMLGLRLSGNLGVMHNRFDYSYTNTLLPGDLPPSEQRINGSASGTAVSAQLSARLERSLTDRSMLTFELGYEALYGIGNGVDTMLDPEGTETEARIDNGSIGGGYLSVGYAFRF